LADETTEIILMRHGETDWNAEGRVQGQDGPGLNAAGRQQAEAAAQSLRGTRIDAIYASDLPRAAETAQIVAAALNHPPLNHDARLREQHLGEWQGLPYTDYKERITSLREFFAEQPLGAAPPGGESRLDVAQRIVPAMNEIAEKHGGERVLVISHGGTLGVLRAIAAGGDAYDTRNHGMENTEIVVITWPLPHPIPGWVGV
jgi:broad specificity phosphatase PhoE